MRTRLINFSLLIASVILSLIIAEIVLRFTPYKNLKRYYGYPKDYFVKDSEMGYDIGRNLKNYRHELQDVPYEIFSNQYGCFDYDRKVPKDYSIVVGDSYTWGYVKLEDSWKSLLESLSKNFMLKCGVTGYGTKQEIIKAKRVIGEVGYNPKYIIMLYTGNDMNDDLAFPHRTVEYGYLVGRVSSINLETGKVNFKSDEKIRKESKKFLSNSVSGYLRRLRYQSVLYNVYMTKIKPEIRKIRIRPKNDVDNVVETVNTKNTEFVGSINGCYGFDLSKHLDETSVDWYNKLIGNNKKDIADFVNYANSIGSKVLFIDIEGNLNHKRYAEIFQMNGIYYYDLSKDYPSKMHKNWAHDGHWNTEGNRDVANYIYQHYKNINLFE